MITYTPTIVQPVTIGPVIKPPTLWQIKFPSILSGLFSFFQAVVTIAIIGCELGSILVDMVTATIYIGIWGGLFFSVAWISQAVASCCCRDHGYALYTMVMQLVSLIIAGCMIGFDAYYVTYPTTCFFPNATCFSTGSARGVFYSSSNFNDVKIPLIKGQLAGASVMFCLCLVNIFLYILTAARVYRSKQLSTIYPDMQHRDTYSLLPSQSVNGLRPVTIFDPNMSRVSEAAFPTYATNLSLNGRKTPYI